MDACMYIFVNKGLGMTAGKVGAQAAHAAVEAYKVSGGSLVNQWYKGGHYKKLVMQARDDTHLLTIERYIQDRGFKTALIIDEGMTEIPKHTATALGVEIVDKDAGHTAATFGSFELYRDKPPVQTILTFDPPKDYTTWQRCLTGFSNATKGRNRA